MFAGTPLTKREYEVLTLRASGMTVKAVAARFGVSDQTVKNQSLQAFRKLGVLGLNEALAAIGMVTTQSTHLVDLLIEMEKKHHEQRINFLTSLLGQEVT